MEVAKGRPVVVPIVVVPVVIVLGVGCELLENGKMGLALLASGFTLLQNDPKELGRGRLRWWWWCWVVTTVASSSSCVYHPEIKRVREEKQIGDVLLQQGKRLGVYVFWG